MKNNILKDSIIMIFNTFNRKILYFLLANILLLSVSNFVECIQFDPNMTCTFSDLVLWNLTNISNIVCIHSVFFLILTYKLIYISKNKYLRIIKYQSKQYWLITCIVSIIILSMFYIIILLITYFIQSLIGLSFDNGWDALALEKWGYVYYNTKIDNLTYFFFPCIVNLFFLFVVISLLYIFIYLFTNKNNVAMISMLFLLISNLAIYKSKIRSLYSFTYLGNSILGFDNMLLNHKPNIIFWIPRIIIYTCLSCILIKNKDLIRIKDDD